MASAPDFAQLGNRIATRMAIRALFESVDPCAEGFHCLCRRCRDHCCECGVPKRPGR
jgi:hypothetical protein